MDLTTHQRAQRRIDLLVALDGAAAFERVADDNRLEMRVVVGEDSDLGPGQAGLDQAGDFFCGHARAGGGSLAAGGKFNPAGDRPCPPLYTSGTRGEPRPEQTTVPAMPPTDPVIARGRRVLEIESQAVAALAERLGDEFAEACRLVLGCAGRTVVTGMGKSGHVGRKIAATLASTGSPAFFLHPAEASHGDIGMITAGDVVLALSNSGETGELVAILPIIKRLGVPLIALTGRRDSTLSRYANVTLDASVPVEACPLNLAPTASTTAALAIGDALAVAVLEARGFTEEDFARSHPAGSLGRRLLLHVDEVMRRGDELPVVGPDTLLAAGLLEMSRKGLGMTTVLEADGRLAGIFTDDDLRRALDRQVDVHGATMRAVMTVGGRVARPRMLAAEAVRLMQEHRITALPVVDDDGRLVGALNVHDLLRAGVM